MTSLPPLVQSVLDLFQGPLSGVRFADIDAAGLAKSAAEVEAASAEVQRQQAALAESQRDLDERLEALVGLAHQALAYARVYAENDEQLSEEVNRIALPKAPKPRKTNGVKAPARDGVRAESAGDPDAPPETVEREIEVDDGQRVTAIEDAAPAPQPAVRRGRAARAAS